MGCINSVSDKQAKNRSRQIDEQVAELSYQKIRHYLTIFSLKLIKIDHKERSNFFYLVLEVSFIIVELGSVYSLSRFY